MAIQRHPVESYNKKLNFWEEFPDYKVHRIFGDFWRANKKSNQLQASSSLMWMLALCYDRKSSFYPQPELDKWEVVGEDLFGNSNIFMDLTEEPEKGDVVTFVVGGTLSTLITAFEESIDTPLGISLRLLERKLADRTAFIDRTAYSMDYYHTTEAGRVVLKKGTADQLDKMFANTEKINSLIQTAMNNLRASEGAGVTKGGQKESLSDGDNTF